MNSMLKGPYFVLGDGPKQVVWRRVPSCQELQQLAVSNDLGADLTTHFMEPLDLADDWFAACFLRFLQQLSSFGARVHWQALRLPDCDPALLHHLPPPATVVQVDQNTRDAIATWQSNYQYGLCHYRVGPGFIEIRDGRDAGQMRRLTIANRTAVDSFEALLQPVASDRMNSEMNRLKMELLKRRLLLRVGGWCFILPYRLRRWPVPHTSL
ncbi:DUF5825 family protein [Streptomyces sp. 1222.5]|uniref:DUF5825 family protein n=1 Tax=Streptomyces sp. 1222.5 TaxID=1881026 RepID=UPI003EBD7214